MEDDALTTYLADHLAGSVGAVELIERELEREAGTPLAGFLGEALDQIRHDQQVLKGILEKRGEKESPTRNAGGWLVDKLRRLKIVDGTSLERMQALEFLVLGMHGRTLLWNALEEVARVHPELQALDFAWLKHQAQAHHDRADRFRIEAARAVFSESVAREQSETGA